MSASLFWIIAAVVCFIIEILAPVGAFIFFGTGCLAAWAVSLTDLSVPWQIASCLVISIVSLVLFRARFRKIFSGSEQTPEIMEHRMRGQSGTVTAPIAAGGEGQVEVAGSFWRARTEDGKEAGKGVKITVIGADRNDALLLIVRRG